MSVFLKANEENDADVHPYDPQGDAVRNWQKRTEEFLNRDTTTAPAITRTVDRHGYTWTCLGHQQAEYGDHDAVHCATIAYSRFIEIHKSGIPKTPEDWNQETDDILEIISKALNEVKK